MFRVLTATLLAALILSSAAEARAGRGFGGFRKSSPAPQTKSVAPGRRRERVAKPRKRQRRRARADPAQGGSAAGVRRSGRRAARACRTLAAGQRSRAGRV